MNAGNELLVAFRTLGCKVNRVESEQIAAELLGQGATICAADDARVIVINTCTVTGEADAKARKAVRQALGARGRPVVVVTGCMAALEPEVLRSIDPRVVIESDKQRVADAVAEALELEISPDARPAVPDVSSGGWSRTRAMLKIQDGCDSYCSYCIVPYARGGPRAVPLSEVVARAENLVDAGAKEIVLTGINIGRYHDGGARLADVVTAVAATGVPRLRLSSIEPLDVDERLVRVLAETPSVCPHLHVPLQGGSDSVLARMSRSYSVREFERRIAVARDAIDGLAVTTDMIAGFPGETDADHEESMAAAARVGFAKVHVFRYSVRRGTVAAGMEQVAAELRAKRAAELRSLGERLRADYIASRAGCMVELLVENVDDGVLTGTTRDYLRVTARCPGAKAGDLVTVRLAQDASEPLHASP